MIAPRAAMTDPLEWALDATRRGPAAARGGERSPGCVVATVITVVERHEREVTDCLDVEAAAPHRDRIENLRVGEIDAT